MPKMVKIIDDKLIEKEYDIKLSRIRKPRLNPLPKKQVVIFFINLVGLILALYCCRYTRDYNSYVYYLSFSPGQILSKIVSIEPLFAVMLLITKIFSSSVIFLYFLSSIIIILLFNLAIREYSDNTILSLIIFYLFFGPTLLFTQIRQGIAVGFFLLSLKDIIDKNIIGFTKKILLATMFHYSAFFLFPLFFLTKKIVRIFLLLVPLLGLVLKSLLTYDILISIVGTFPEFLRSKILVYLNESIMGLHEINLFNKGFISILIIYYFFLLFIKTKKESDLMALKLLGLGIFLWLGLSAVPIWSFRITNYFFISIAILLPRIVSCVKDPSFKLLLSVLIIIYSCFAFYESLATRVIAL